MWSNEKIADYMRERVKMLTKLVAKHRQKTMVLIAGSDSWRKEWEIIYTLETLRDECLNQMRIFEIEEDGDEELERQV